MERKLKIMISDDSKLLRKKLRKELEDLGCDVIEAENGKEAVMKDLQEQPDGIFLDIVMPEVGGIEVLQVFKEVNPKVPVIMLSSAGTPQKLMETLRLGALDFIQKPYTSAQIVKALDAIRKRAEQNADDDGDEGLDGVDRLIANVAANMDSDDKDGDDSVKEPADE